jgi:uncharacterized protein YjbI with pentapeptide repeats
VSEVWSWLSQHLGVIALAIGVLVLTAVPTKRIGGQVDPTTGQRPFKPLSKWTIYVLSVLGVAFTLGIGWFLWGQVAAAPVGQAQLTIEVVKTTLTAGLGIGGLFALYVSLRRQWLSEQEHMLQKGVAASNQLDQTEKRVTELYSKAVDQLASEHAPVRLAALYALERLADTNLKHRQTIVDVICAYLRIRRNEPETQSQETATGRDEVEVRATAQKIFRAHFEKDAKPDNYWDNIHLDLHGARLEDFSLHHCEVSDVDFRGAEFIGETRCSAASFKGDAHFEGAIFRGPAIFSYAEFSHNADFDKTEFCDRAEFEKATFQNFGSFYKSLFRDVLFAVGIRAGVNVDFRESEFMENLYMRSARIGSDAQFDDSVFHKVVQLVGTKADTLAMNHCTFHDFIDLDVEARVIDLARSTIKKDAAEHIFPPGDWYIKEDVPGDFAIFRAPYMDEREKKSKEDGQATQVSEDSANQSTDALEPAESKDDAG